MAENKDKLVTAGGIKAVYKKIKDAYATKAELTSAIESVDVTEQLQNYAKTTDVANAYLTKADANATYAKSVDTNAVSEVVTQNQTDIEQLKADVEANKGNVYDVNYDADSGLFSFYENPTYENDEISAESQAKKAFTIKGGGGGGSTPSSTLTVTRIGESVQTIRQGSAITVGFTYSSLEDDGSENPIPGTAVWKRNGVTFSTTDAVAGDNTIDISNRVLLGTNNISVTVTDPAGSILTRTWSITVIDVALTSTFDDSLTYTAGEPVSFRYTPIGTIEKTIYFVHGGEVIDTVTTSSSNIPQTYIIPAQPHGTYDLEIYAKAQLGSSTIETEHLYFDIIFYNASNSTPIIGIGKTEYTTKQYNTVPITYYVYTNAETATVTQKVYLNDELENSSEVTVIGSEDTWNFKPTQVGTYTLVISCGDTEKTITIEAETLGIDVSVAEGSIFDFNPSGYSNNNTETRLWTNGTVSMTVSDNFDWTNGGYQVDENGDTYFCVKAGTQAFFDHKLFASDAKQKGKNFKVIYKVENVRIIDTTFLSCAQGTNDTGIVIKPHNAYVNSSTQTLTTPLSEEDIIEYEFNITTDKSLIPMFMSYEDGVGSRAIVYENGDNFTQNDPQPISIGSLECDVRIYRMRAYESPLDNSNILNNFIADARNAEEMIDRYTRNQIYNASGVLTPESVMEACPELRVITIEAPWLTSDKKEKVSGCKVTMQYKGTSADSEETILYNNWVADGTTIVGQGTSSNAYKASGQNLDFDMKKATISLTKQSGNNTVSKIKLTSGSISTNYLNAKVNIASSENENNALLQKRYDRYLPYTSAAKIRDSKIKNSMEFYNCVIFLKETDTSKAKQFNDEQVHFYAIGNIGDSKKTDSTRTSDPSDVKEFCVEVQDVDRSLSRFPALDKIISEERQERQNNVVIYTKKADDTLVEVKTGTALSSTTEYFNAEGVKIDDITTVSSIVTIPSVNALQALENDLFDESDTYGFRYGAKPCDEADAAGYADGNPLKDDKGRFFKSQADMDNFNVNCEVFRNFYKFIVRDLTTNGVEDPVKVATWKTEFSDWFIRDAALYYYLFTLRYTMVDNRAKNLFLHYGKCEDGKYRFDYWDYDNDTSLGIDNAGKLTMSYGVEDEDTDADGNEYFRCSSSILFTRIAKYFSSEILELYNRCDSNCWSSDSLIKEFDTYQSQFPEELWRLDIERKYFRPYSAATAAPTTSGGYADAGAIMSYPVNSMYLTDMMNGKKKYQRRQFERDQDKYMDSKFIGLRAMNDYMSIRSKKPVGATPNYVVKITPYANMYLSIFSELKRENPLYHQRVYAGQEYSVELYPSSASPDFTFIYTGSRIQSLGDLNQFYVSECNLGNAEKLQSIKLGDSASNYTNAGLTSFGVTSAPLLSNVNIQNCPNLKKMDCSNLHHLTTFEAAGSGLESITFADGGELQTAHLPAVTSLTLKNLDSLTDLTIADYDNLIELTLENINTVNTYELIKNSLNLLRLRLIGANWTASYNIPNKDILDRMASLKGFDASAHNIDQSVVTGYIYVKTIGSQYKTDFQTLWNGLTIDAYSITSQHKVTFYDEDATTILQTMYIDDGGTINTDDIITPTKPQDLEYVYSFNKWIGVYDLDGEVINDISFKASYTKTPRQYTVKYVIGESPNAIVFTTQAGYGSYVYYTDFKENSNYKEIPEHPNDKFENRKYYLFKGWDKSGYVNGDKTITAVFDSYTYNHTDLKRYSVEQSEGTVLSATRAMDTPDLKDIEPIKLYAMLESARNRGYDSVAANELFGYLNSEDPTVNEAIGSEMISFKTGLDYVFEDVDSIEVPKTYFNAASLPTVVNNKMTYVKYDDIKLFDVDKDFTFVIDFQYLSGVKANQVIAQCSIQNQGFTITQNSSNQIVFTSTGNNSITINTTSTGRDIIALRHRKGDSKYYLYISNLSSNKVAAEYSLNMPPLNDASLCLGATMNLANTGINTTSGITPGIIHFAKFWNTDLGYEECIKNVQWVREEIEATVIGIQRYEIAPSGSGLQTCYTLINNRVSAIKSYWNSSSGNSGGWGESDLRQILNEKMFKTFPLEWQQIISPAIVYSSIGDGSYDMSYSANHLALPSIYEFGLASISPYTDEGVQYQYFINNQNSELIVENTEGNENSNYGYINGYWTRSPYRAATAGDKIKVYRIALNTQVNDQTGDISVYPYTNSVASTSTYGIRAMFSI